MDGTPLATEKEEKIRSKKLFFNGASCFKICNRLKFKQSKFCSNSKSEEPINNRLHSRVAAFGDCVKIENSITGSPNESSQRIDHCCFLVTVLASLKSSLSGKSRKDRSQTDNQSPGSDEIISDFVTEPAVNNGKTSFEIRNAREETTVKVQDQPTTDVADVENGGIRQQSATGRSLSSKHSRCSANAISGPANLTASSESRTNDSIGKNQDEKEQLPLKGEVYFFSDSNIGMEKFDRKGRRTIGNNSGNKKLFRKLEVDSGNKNVNKNKSSDLFRKGWAREINNNNNGCKQSTLNSKINRLPTKRPKRMPNSNDRMTRQQSRRAAAAEIVFVDDGNNCVEKGNRTTASRDERAKKGIVDPIEARPIVTNKDERLQSDCTADTDFHSERRRSVSNKVGARCRGAAIVSKIPIWKRRCPMRYCNKPEMKSIEVQTSTIVGMYEWNAENVHRYHVPDEPEQAEVASSSSDTIGKSGSNRPAQNSIAYYELTPAANRPSYSCPDRNSTASLPSSPFGQKSPIVDDVSAKTTRRNFGDSVTTADGKDQRSSLDSPNRNTVDQAIFDKYESLQILNEDFLRDNVDKDNFLATSLAELAPSTAADPLLLASYRCDNKQVIEDISTAFGEFQELSLQEKIRLLEELVNRALEEIPESADNALRAAAEEKDAVPEGATLSDERYVERENDDRSTPKPDECQVTTRKTSFLKPCRLASSRIPRLRYHPIVPIERTPNGAMFQTDSRTKLKATAKLSISIPSLSSSSADFHIHSVISEITVNSNTNTPLKYLTSYANVPDTLTDVPSLKSEVPFAFDPVPARECCDRSDGTSNVKHVNEEEEARAAPIASELLQFTLDETDRTNRTDKGDDHLAASLDHLRLSPKDDAR